MYMVYWISVEQGEAVPQAKSFDATEMSAAMTFIEQLRTRRRAGEDLRFITMCSEHPHAVGEAGVAEPGPNYQWKKRRK